MEKLKVAVLLCATALSAGCASGLNSFQEQEYAAMEAANVIVKEKDPTTGAVLGILPGGGSFYSRHPGLGIVNLLFWPLSILWDPVSGHDGAKVINYNVTKHKLKKDMQREMLVIDDRHTVGEIDATAYLKEKRKIEEKYNF